MSFKINLPPNAPGTVAPPDSTRPPGDVASAASRLATVAELPPHHTRPVDRGLYWKALREGNHEVLKAVLSKRLADPNDCGDDSPLTFSAWDTRLECIDVLVEHGADLNALSKKGRTALGQACREGQTQAVKKLIKHGADVKLFKKRSQPPLVECMRHCGLIPLDELIALMEPLLEAGANMNATGKKPVPALNIACERENWPVVAYLLARGASLDIADKRGDSPRTMLRPEALMKRFEAAFKKNDKEAMSTFVSIVARLVPDDKAARALVKMAIALAGDSPDLAERIHTALSNYLEAVPENHPVPVEVVCYVAEYNAKVDLLALGPESWARLSDHVPYKSDLHGLDAIQLAATMTLDPPGSSEQALEILSFVARQAFAQETSLSHREALLAAATRLLEDLRNSPSKAVAARAPLLEAALWAFTHPL